MNKKNGLIMALLLGLLQGTGALAMDGTGPFEGRNKKAPVKFHCPSGKEALDAGARINSPAMIKIGDTTWDSGYGALSTKVTDPSGSRLKFIFMRSPTVDSPGGYIKCTYYKDDDRPSLKDDDLLSLQLHYNFPVGDVNVKNCEVVDHPELVVKETTEKDSRQVSIIIEPKHSSEPFPDGLDLLFY